MIAEEINEKEDLNVVYFDQQTGALHAVSWLI